MEFPGTGDRHRYRPDDVLPPQPDEEHQDAAAWVLVAVGSRCAVLAWEYSGHLITTARLENCRQWILGPVRGLLVLQS